MPTVLPGKPEEGLFGLSGDGGKGIHARNPDSAPNSPETPERLLALECACLDCGATVDELTLLCPPCMDHRREPNRLPAFVEERRRHYAERAAWAAAALTKRYCLECGFSSWFISPRGDSSCYGCTLIREGRPLRCGACGGEEWRRNWEGRRACVKCEGTEDDRQDPPAPVNDPCYCCRGTDYWLTHSGNPICRRCHPPAPGAEREPR